MQYHKIIGTYNRSTIKCTKQQTTYPTANAMFGAAVGMER